MKAMILAAGFGKRMLPLTKATPKPLLALNGKPLIQWRIEALVQAGVTTIVINHAHLGGQIVDFCGSGERFGASIFYSAESEPLETAGGIKKALPLLGEDPFIIVNSDIATDFDFTQLVNRELGNNLGHLVLTDNPEHNPHGDFSLDSHGLITTKKTTGYTYTGIALLSPAFFDEFNEDYGPMKPLMDNAIRQVKLSGEYFKGLWADIGTPQRLQELQV